VAILRAMPKAPQDLPQHVATAAAEDIGSADITAELVLANQHVSGKVVTRALLAGWRAREKWKFK
jgi:nicotinate-nucleotide pyrophosphorylase